MPFPVDEKYILAAEEKLGVTFPSGFRIKMMADNGGTVEAPADEEIWDLYPFFDTSDKKRVKRTCNDIVRETASAKEWTGFPANAVAIGANGCGDRLVLLANVDGSVLQDEVFCWDHETGDLDKVADDFAELESV
ncbi:SMI1 / KNR4 family protein [Mycobacterium basiliense]|uniref:SMI1 / KNR4 family protein n=1 Tax=Mycobacterium basiliense TaxID=2094119 RepID=A0A447GCS5_9MYCO|nr:SMI1/KNR4 family protein [Mycobacterium basiliense]VDM88189.1 SMI1 / KNR4 family protein [Mycobacterium basiliense]